MFGKMFSAMGAAVPHGSNAGAGGGLKEALMNQARQALPNGGVDPNMGQLMAKPAPQGVGFGLTGAMPPQAQGVPQGVPPMGMGMPPAPQPMAPPDPSAMQVHGQINRAQSMMPPSQANGVFSKPAQPKPQGPPAMKGPYQKPGPF